MGGVGWLSLRGDGWHGHGHGAVGTVDPPFGAETDDDLSLSGAGVCSNYCCRHTRRSAASNPGGGCTVDIRWGWSSVLSLAVVAHMRSHLRLLGAARTLRCTTLDAYELSCLQTESG